MFCLIALLLCVGTCLALSVPEVVPVDPSIVGGNPVQPGHRWKWQLSLQWFDDEDGRWKHTCGASLLNSTHALTAAHCTEIRGSDLPYRVLLGATTNTDDTDATQIINITKIVAHPRFLDPEATIGNDVCVLELAKTAITGDKVEFAKLADRKQKFAGRKCWATGWGKLNGTLDQAATRLHEVEMDCITVPECNRRLPNETIDVYNAAPQHICIHSDTRDKGACQGDSGGPLNCPDDEGRWTVAGIASWVIPGPNFPEGSCDPEFPTMYSRVSYFRDFIDFNEDTTEPTEEPALMVV